MDMHGSSMIGHLGKDGCLRLYDHDLWALPCGAMVNLSQNLSLAIILFTEAKGHFNHAMHGIGRDVPHLFLLCLFRSQGSLLF